ncbi:hypothetical protein EXS70_01385 [Candidatus Peribacteria bacterium]|nr:hypothetical protein [Candidatus Peribacteria bacterium]
MTNEMDISPAPRRPNLSTLLWHMAWPFLIFSCVLFSLLALSWILLLPRYTRIDVGGQLRTAEGILSYREELTAQITQKEEQRRQLVLAVHDPQFEWLKDQRRARMTLDELNDALVTLAKETTGKDDVVAFTSLQYDPGKRTLAVKGDIRNVGTRSMTALAAYVAAIRTLPFVASTTTPTFTRDEKPDGFHSPFMLTVTLK